MMLNLPRGRTVLYLTGTLVFVAACRGGAQQRSDTTGLPLPVNRATQQGERGEDVKGFWVRPGYRLTKVAEIDEARFIEFGENGTLYLSRPRNGDIVTLRPEGERYVKKATFVSGHPTVQGLSWQGGWLWFAESQALFRARDTNGDGKADEVVTVIERGKLPGGSGHFWRSLLVTDSYIFTSVGDSGNITDETATERQKIFRFNKDGSGKRLWSSGIRNTEKLRMRPGTNELYGVDHGSDWFGAPLGDKEGNQPITDFNPPDELNRYIEGGFYGHPFITGNRLPRIEYQKRPDIIELANKTIPPIWSFGPHWATNSFTFLTQSYFGKDHVGDMFVASRGSWNRKERSGYRVERVLFDKVTGAPYGSLMIVGALGQDGTVLARPVDCAEAPDGSVLFTSDSPMGAIYRISKPKG